MAQTSETAPKISASNTKKEILEAYSQIKEMLEAKARNELRPEEEKEKKQQRGTTNAAEKLVGSGVSGSIESLKSSLNTSLSEIAGKMEEAVSQYTDIKKAIEVREQELSDLFAIEKSAFSLAALMETQKQKREEFETAMEIQRETWEKEQDEYAATMKEQKSQDEKNRKREQEEYDYRLKRDREQKTNELQDQIKQLEKELSSKREAFELETASKEAEIKAREEAVARSEKEIIGLQVEVDNFPQKLDKAVAKAVKEISEKLTSEAERNENILTKTFEGEKNVLATKIESLEHLTAEQKKQTELLSAQLEKAYGKVQDIAVKAVSGSRDRQFSGQQPGKQEDNS